MEQEQENDHQQRMTMLENDQLFLESQTKISLRGLAYLFVLVLILLLSGVENLQKSKHYQYKFLIVHSTNS